MDKHPMKARSHVKPAAEMDCSQQRGMFRFRNGHHPQRAPKASQSGMAPVTGTVNSSMANHRYQATLGRVSRREGPVPVMVTPGEDYKEWPEKVESSTSEPAAS